MDSSKGINGTCLYLMYISPNAPIAGMMQIEIASNEFHGSKAIQTLICNIENEIRQQSIQQ
jgi:hypothetical protein